LALGGVPNFFGHQRFGTTRPVTHLVGKAIVKGDLEDAALTFLTYSTAHENPEVKEVRDELHETRDFKEALSGFTERFRYERLMLRHLVGFPSDFAGALRQLPLRLRMLFVEAYQSFLFNKFLSERIHRNSKWSTVDVGDYVVALDERGLPMKSGKVVTTELLSAVSSTVASAKACVAVPFVGFEQPLSQGAQGEIEEKVLADEGTSPEVFKCASMPELANRGGLRTVLAPLIDFDPANPIENTAHPEECELRLTFSLRKGSYATVPLREFMKPKDPISAGF